MTAIKFLTGVLHISMILAAIDFMYLTTCIVRLKAGKVIRAWVRVLGTVKSADGKSGSRGIWTWKVSYEFCDKGGNRHERIFACTGNKNAQFTAGAGIYVMYDPEHPEISRAVKEMQDIGLADKSTGELLSQVVILIKAVVSITVAVLLLIAAFAMEINSSVSGAVFALYFLELIMFGGCGLLKASRFFVSKITFHQ